jgi:hypothetical protein
MSQSYQDQTKNINEWIQSAMHFWKNFSPLNAHGDQQQTTQDTFFTGSQKTDQFFISGFNMIQLLIANLLEPDNIDETLKKSDAISSASIEILQQFTDSFMEMQKQWIERFVRIGLETKAYRFDDIDKEMFTSWQNIYEKEFQKFFKIPTIGLLRYYQERAQIALDKFHLFQESLSELLYYLYIPFEKTAQIFQKEMEKQIEQGHISNNVKEHYNQWIKILEGHFMALLKSSEYSEVLNKAIYSYVQFKNAKDAVLMDLLQHLPVPTYKEMDELYKDIYELKQTVKLLKTKLENQ